ncbi:CFA/I fimbrial minor adhesin (plasmid) [Klebsiella sp. PL-2018]|nr:CFA/I fimbrial minor adhesin [Klebsiella sp. PL-2018]
MPKEYGISIVSSNYTSSSSGSGTIGDAHPIEMDYTVTVSGPRQADSITAQVIGESMTINNVLTVCLRLRKAGCPSQFPLFCSTTVSRGAWCKNEIAAMKMQSV